MAARDPGAALRKASSPGRSRVPVYRSEALSSMEAARQGAFSRTKPPDSLEIHGVFEGEVASEA